MPLDSDEVGQLVVALLCMNNYLVDRAAGLVPAMRERGLLDPVRVAATSQEAAIGELSAAGYARGGYLPIITFRLFALIEDLGSGKLDALPSIVAAGKKDEFISALAGVHGFGPRTAETAWLLWPTSPAT